MTDEFEVTVYDEHGNISHPVDHIIDYSGETSTTYVYMEHVDAAVATESYYPQHTVGLPPLETVGLENYQLHESPFNESAVSDPYLSPTYTRPPARRHSDHEKPPSLTCRTRSSSVSNASHIYPQNARFYSTQPYNHDSISPSTTSSGDIPSPLVTSASKSGAFADGEENGLISPYSPSQALNHHWAGYGVSSPVQVTVGDGLPSPLLSPSSDISSHLSLSPTDSGRGRGFSPSHSRRHSPYPRSRSRSTSRIVGDMHRLSLDGGSYSRNLSPNMTSTFLGLPPSEDTRLDPVANLPNLRSFEEVTGHPEIFDNSQAVSPYTENSFTLLQDQDGYQPLSPNLPVSPHELQAGFRPKVGSPAIEKAASLRRTRPGEHSCTYPGCGATFTAKHNLQNHINSHMGIRNHKCVYCDRDFGTSHVAKRHMKKCNGKRKRVSSSPS